MKTFFTIKDNREAARQTWRIELDCGFRPGMHAGQFVDVALDGFFLRRPISVCDITDSGLVLAWEPPPCICSAVNFSPQAGR